jgi:hypothetical protein
VELAGVEQHEGRQLDRPGRGVDRAGIALLDEERQQAAVVEMRVGHQHRVQLARFEGERDPVADGLVRAALEHAAVDEDARSRGLDEVLRAGDGGRATEEVDLHGFPVRPG